MKMNVSNPEAVVRRAFFLAWQACGGPVGMGLFQDRGPDMTEEQVWAQAVGRGDYDGLLNNNKPGEVYGDYVFGRMMKVGFKWDAESVDVPENATRPDYQSWCRTYPTYQALVEAAVKSLAG